jgi:hypothetical protein
MLDAVVTGDFTTGFVDGQQWPHETPMAIRSLCSSGSRVDRSPHGDGKGQDARSFSDAGLPLRPTSRTRTAPPPSRGGEIVILFG